MQLFGSCHTKVSDFIHSIMDEDVSWLQVSMDDVELAQVLETLANLKEHIDQLVDPFDFVLFFFCVAVIEKVP